MSCGVGCCLITRSVRVATVEQALAMTRRWLTNHSGYCLGNSSSSPPSPPAPAHNGQSLSTWWSSKYNDNAICIRGGVNCDKAAAARSLDTNTVAAKHHSAKADVHFGDCCPLPMHQKDGLAPPVLDPAYKFMRTESYLMPTHAEIAVAAGITLVELQMVYSKANQDNFLGTANASALPGYNAVVGCSVDEQYNLSAIPARIFAEPPNASYVPMDLYWSEKRKDYQNVASIASRHWLCTQPSCGADFYVFVQRLGYVMIADGGWAPGKNNATTMGPCRYSLPSTPNDDPAYKDNSYWRGRVWGPLNYLVYMGLAHPKYANEPEIAAARKQLAIQSREALMVEWLPKHHVHENLNPDTGLGDDVGNSNPMYHWGALMSFIEVVESGRFYPKKLQE